MMKRLAVAAVVVLTVLSAREARADVDDATNAGFAIKIAVDVAASPAVVFRAITRQIGSWWSADHTFSGSASNLLIDARPGGCFCERLPAGGVQHMVVTHVNAPNLLVLHGGLGPLGALAVSGSLSIAITDDSGTSHVVLSYDVGGYTPKGLTTLAPAVDGVLTEQVRRLKNFVERGAP